MKRMLQVLSGLMLALVILVGVLFAASWLFWPTRAQEQALAMLTTPAPEPQGRNAFADVWLLRYDLSPEARERIAAEDVARFNRRPVVPDDAAPAEPFVSGAEAGHREEKLPPSSDHGCGLRAPDCLGRVRNAPDKAAALLSAHAGLLQRSRDALEHNDYLRNRFRMQVDMPFAIAAMSDGAALMRIDAALAFVRGERERGMESTCRSVVAWRRWMRQPDLLIDAMMGDAAIRGWLELQGQMLVELPVGAPLPAVCRSLREPPPLADDAMCRVIKREFEFSRPMFERDGTGGAATWGASTGRKIPFVYRPHATQAMIAETMTWPCGEAAHRQRLVDQPVTIPAPAAQLRLECVANSMGCILNDIGRPAMAPYQHRLQDQRARLNLMATLLWLREQPVDGRTLAQRVAARPVALRQGRDIEVVEDRLRIPLFDAGEKAYWELAVPETLR